MDNGELTIKYRLSPIIHCQLSIVNRPLVFPLDNRLFSFEADRQPNVSAVYGILGCPAVAHIDEPAWFSGDRQHVCALRMERGFRIGSHKRVRQLFPRPPDRGSNSRTARIRRPAGTTGHDQVILAVFLEHGRRFHEATDE